MLVLQEERSLCQMRAIRALYTRLLFILTRCSRLLITEQQHLFATEPRNARRPGGMYSGHSMTMGQPYAGGHARCPARPSLRPRAQDMA